MVNVLKKIPLRKAIREKGKSACIIAAVFFTTVLFVTVFSTLFFVMDAAEEMLRANSPILADAALSVTEAEYEKIRQSPRVSEASFGIRLALTHDAPGAVDIQLFTFEEKMAMWMNYYPAKGRMPESGNEVVVSDQYLRERGLSYAEHMPLEMTYELEDESYTDTFMVVGVYEMSGQPLHAILTSDDFCQNVFLELKRREIAPENATYRMAGLTFASRGNVRQLFSLLAAETGLTLDEGQSFLNDASVFDDMGPGVWAALICLLLSLMIIGYLFISNIFRISVATDARFYGKLSTGGVTRREIKRLFRRQNRILFVIAAIPALLAGYAFSSAMLPGILNACTTLQVKRNLNPWIFVLSLAFSYITMRVSERRPLKLAKNASPIEMKKYMGSCRPVKSSDNKNCLNKFIKRHFRSDRAKALKVCISIALSILLAVTFYTIVAGFDEEEYVSSDLDADYLIAKKPILTNPNVNLYSYERTAVEEITPCKQLPGIISHGGGSSSHICLNPPDEVWDRFVGIAGEDCYSTPGEMVTEVYGLDDLLLEALTPISGTIDRELFHTGNYVLLDPILGEEDTSRSACYAPGEEVTIPFMSGEEKTYTVMAIVESLPYSLSLPGRYYASNLYLPRAEWQAMEHRDDYYLYVFNVEEACHEAWDATLTRMTAGSGGRLAYRSAKTATEEARAYINGLKLAGFVLSIILLSMGILNFINCTVSSIYSRRKELAILQSMGLTEGEIQKALIREGLLYILGGFVPGAVSSVPLVYLLLEALLMEPCIRYRFYPLIYLLFAALSGSVALLVPWAVYRTMNHRENFPERIRACRE